MVKADAARHGALGASGSSSGRIESGISCYETCRSRFSHGGLAHDIARNRKLVTRITKR
jgi:hypothetical protein